METKVILVLIFVMLGITSIYGGIKFLMQIKANPIMHVGGEKHPLFWGIYFFIQGIVCFVVAYVSTLVL